MSTKVYEIVKEVFKHELKWNYDEVVPSDDSDKILVCEFIVEGFGKEETLHLVLSDDGPYLTYSFFVAGISQDMKYEEVLKKVNNYNATTSLGYGTIISGESDIVNVIYRYNLYVPSEHIDRDYLSKISDTLVKQSIVFHNSLK